MRSFPPTLFFLSLISSTCLADATEWPQFRGPNRDGVSPSTGLLSEWPDGGPELVWTATGAGRGYSSVSIADGKMLTLGDAPSTADDEDEYLLCWDVATGEQLWKQHIGPAWKAGGPDHWQSSRSTPTIDRDRAYALTGHGTLFCCSITKNGEILWQVDLKEKFKGDKGDSWGYGESVLIDGDRVVCTPGKEANTMVALNKMTGETIWTAARPEDRGAGHASIQISEVGGVKVYVNTTASGALGVRASDGELMWSYPIDKTTAVIPSPIIRGDLVFFTVGYNRGGALLRQIPKGDRVEMEEVYPLNKKLENKHGGLVLVGDHLYGDSGDGGIPFCAELMTGDVVWKSRGSGKGSAAVAAADGHLYIVFENSKVVLVPASPDEYQETGSIELETDDDTRKTWAHPVIIGGRFYVRQDDKIFCYDVSK